MKSFLLKTKRGSGGRRRPMGVRGRSSRCFGDFTAF